MKYYYYIKTIEPNLLNIHTEVANSIMTDKSLHCCVWHEDNTTLEIHYINELNANDKLILDDIINNI